MLLLTGVLLATALAFGGLLVALLIALAKRVVHPRPHRITPAVIAANGGSIELGASPLTLAPGRYGVWFGDGSHAVAGDVIAVDAARGTVVRELLTERSTLGPGPVDTRWSGHVFPAPGALGLPFGETTVAGASGPCPAWLFPADAPAAASAAASADAPGTTPTTRAGGAGDAAGEGTGLWAIHIHGFNTDRITALRGVPALHALGFTSLVVSYRGDGEAATVPGAPSCLGTVEHTDIEAAVDHAVRNGARSIVLVGWSMGALLALRVAERSPHRELVSGLVLVGPLAGWRWAIEAGASAAGLPALLGRVVTAFLQTTVGARAVGARRAYPLREFDWTRPDAAIAHPTLVLHSPGDTDVPLASSHTLAARDAHRVRLVEFEPVPHCMEWNAEPERFERAIADWWRQQAGLNTVVETRAARNAYTRKCLHKFDTRHAKPVASRPCVPSSYPPITLVWW